MKEYYSQYKLGHPAYMVVKTAGPEIKKYARKYFKGKLLDIGCGTKSKQHLIGDIVQEYVGLDHADSLHDLSHVDIFGTAYKIPEPDRSYDSVLCTAVLEHLEEPCVALKEASRVIKPGGHAIYTVPLFWHLHEEPRDFYRYTKYGLKYLFEKAGFDIVEIKPLSGFWITFGSELNYYLSSGTEGFFANLLKPAIALNNIIFPLLNKLDMKFHRGADRWTWLYLVVAIKPTDNE
jgi:ubiquinone/menaquinone biosynthesis C-methylase UbiE